MAHIRNGGVDALTHTHTGSGNAENAENVGEAGDAGQPPFRERKFLMRTYS